MTEAPEITVEEIQARLGDRKWRLNNLYHIRDPYGRKVLFKMNPIQEYLHDNLHYRNVIPKARKLGISTFFSILNLDQILFSKNRTAGIIAHRQEDVKKLFRNNVLFAVENLHPWLKQEIGKPDISTANEIVFNNGGSIYVSLTTRGQTPQFLHVSELGYICKHSPDKADEIVSGAINSVAAAGLEGETTMVSIESTADSGRSGHFYDIVMSAERKRLDAQPLTALDWKEFFFAWWLDPRYKLEIPEGLGIKPETYEYFKQLQQVNDLRTLSGEKIKISPEQMLWYEKTLETNQDNMFSQYPSTLEEAFSVSLDGAYYAKDVNALFAENRVAFFPIDPMYPVDTAWDLGMNDSTAVVFFQSIGPEIRFVDFYENNGVGLAHYADMLRTKGYRYGKHIFPHDVNVRDLSTGVSRLNMLWELGVANTIVAPKVFISDGIEKVRLLFHRFRFDKQKAGKIVDGLQTYRKQWDDKKGVWSDNPFHGPESHVADAVRTMAVVWYEQFGNEGRFDQDGKMVSGERIESFFG